MASQTPLGSADRGFAMRGHLQHEYDYTEEEGHTTTTYRDTNFPPGCEQQYPLEQSGRALVWNEETRSWDQQ